MSDDDLALELRRRPCNTASGLALILRLPRAEVDAGLRRLVHDGRAQLIGTSNAFHRHEIPGEDVYDPKPAHPWGITVDR